MLKLFNIYILFLFFTTSVIAQGLAQPEGQVILTVKTKYGKMNSDVGAKFDFAMLASMPQQIIETQTPWTKGVSKFEGPAVKDVLSFLEISGTSLSATALNGYKIVIPMEDVEQYSIILALKHNDEILSVRQRGPSWIIYPWSSTPALQNSIYYTRSIWQLVQLEVH